jgi:hypothetical protein
MLHGFLNFIYFLFTAAISGFIFKLVASLIELISTFGVFGVLTGFKVNLIDEGFEKSPKRTVFVLVGQRVIVGTLNAIMIFVVTAGFLQRTGANFWLYVALSIIWSLFIITYSEYFILISFLTSTVILILFWLGFGSWSYLIVAPLTFLVSLAYYMGRAGVITEEKKSM